MRLCHGDRQNGSWGFSCGNTPWKRALRGESGCGAWRGLAAGRSHCDDLAGARGTIRLAGGGSSSLPADSRGLRRPGKRDSNDQRGDPTQVGGTPHCAPPDALEHGNPPSILNSITSRVLPTQSRYRIKNHVDGNVLTHAGVDHHVVALALRPIDLKVLPDEERASDVHLFCKFERFLFGLAGSMNVAYFVVEQRVDEDVQGVNPVCQIVSAAAANDDAIARFGHFLHNLLRDLADAIGIYHLHALRIDGAFKTSPQKRFEKTVVRRIAALFAFFDGAPLAIHAEGNLVCEPLVPKLPAQPFRQLFGDDAGAASEFTIDRDNANGIHISPHSDLSTPAWFVLFDRKRKQDQDGRGHSENHKRVDIGQRSRLRDSLTVDSSIGLSLSQSAFQAGNVQALGESLNRPAKIKTSTSDVFAHIALLHLRASRNPSSDHRGADAAADAAREIQQSRTAAAR